MSRALHLSSRNREHLGRTWAVVLSCVVALAAAPAGAASVMPSDFDGPGGASKALPRTPVVANGTDILNVNTTQTYGTIQAALDDPLTLNGHVLEVQVTSHAEGIVTVHKSVTIRGFVGGATLTPTTNTGSSGDARGWFLVTASGVTFEDLTFDGTGFLIYQAIRITLPATGGLIQRCDFAHMAGSTYDGRGIATTANITVRECTFTDMRRIGVHIFGATVTSALVTECTYNGKGAGDWLDYGIELGGGAVATLTKNTITNCTGVATSDGSTSAGVLITDYFAPGTAATLDNNFITGNTMGIAVGYLATDMSVAVVHDNDLSGNDGGAQNTNAAHVVDLSANWWGVNDAASVAASVGTGIDYTPWLHVGTDTNAAVGFQGDFSALDVDDDSPQTGALGRIAEAVGLVSGSTVYVGPGLYEEQVVITTNGLTLQGAGVGSTIIKSPLTLTASFTTSTTNKPVVFVNGATNVTIQDLTVDGAGRGNANVRFSGVAFWNSGGKLANVDVIGVRDTPFSGAQHGVAVYAFNNTAGPYTLEIANVTVSDFQKNAMALNGNGNLTVDVHDCTATGAGPTAVTAQNGIQLWGASGTIADCTVTGVFWTGPTWTASGLLLFGPGAVTVSGTTLLAGCQTGVYSQDVDADIGGVNVSGWTELGTLFYNTSTSKAGVGAMPAMTVREASPFGDTESAKATLPGLQATNTVSLHDGCFLGADSVASIAVEVYSAGGPLVASVSNLEISDWDYGILVGGAASSVTANNNSITSSVTAAFDNSGSLAVQNAEYNWWGSASGPSGGNAVLGTGVDYYPWLSNGTDLNPGCGFTPSVLAVNTVTPTAPATCIATVSPCVTVPVDIARADALAMRGFSVDIQLSTNLMLCAGTSSITQGTYLSGSTNFQVLDNGGGSYTVDCAILGLPCGATAPTGNLFSIAVKNSGGDGTGTVTVADVIARDCNNAPISVIPGPAASITIDNTLPVAIANLAAAQLKTLNDSDGTTKIQLTFTAPPDAALVEVYRAGYGQYPEYDDAGGAVPATPTYPPGAPWTLTGVTASGGTDEVATPRDFWYYVAFSKDACGNVSAVSNKTNGTLNYHLGDVSDAVTPGVGNNVVNTADISLLGAHYGITLGAPPAAWDYLDVGPTTDYSVDARPTTDNQVQFEDLMMFAINYGTVSKTGAAMAPARTDELLVLTPEGAEIGGTLVAHLWLRGTGRVQGLSVRMQWDAAVVEPIGVEAGELVLDLDGVVLSPEPGTVDVALLGVRDLALAGEGDVATVRFRVIGSGDPGLALAAVDARDHDNRQVEMSARSDSDPQANLPRVTALLANVPNPFNPSTKIPFTLAVDGPVELSIFTVDGRKIRTLVNDTRQPGLFEALWDGTDDRGNRVSSGAYYVRLVTREGSHSRPVVMLK